MAMLRKAEEMEQTNDELEVSANFNPGSNRLLLQSQAEINALRESNPV
jgi:hypothetical protein